MKWTDIRQHFPHQWLLVEATRAHTTDDRRIVEDLAVVECFPSGENAMQGYSRLHRREPHRELYVLHTDREQIEITELNWLGTRCSSPARAGGGGDASAPRLPTPARPSG